MTVNLDEAILINESKVEGVAGDVSLFKDARHAAESLEIVDVQNGEYFAYRLDGIRLRIEVHGGTIQFTEDLGSESMDIVRGLLLQTAEHVRRARVLRTGESEAKGHSDDLGQLSTVDLIQLVGFST